ncbi:MAG: peptide deformylase [Perlabentimonas sp.]
MNSRILKYGSSILRQQSAEVTNNDDVSALVHSLFEVLSKEGGVGLAAPQIGILKQVFVIDTSSMANDYKVGSNARRVIINPIIITQSDEANIYKEGCLSFPNIFEEIIRPEKIVVRYFDEQLNQVEQEFNDIDARVFQHEFDHLNGILFIDRISKLRRTMIAGKLKRITRSSKNA